jgi:hypothetical protein
MRVMKIPFALSLSKPVMSLSNEVNVNPLMVRLFDKLTAHHERFDLTNITRFLELPKKEILESITLLYFYSLPYVTP